MTAAESALQAIWKMVADAEKNRGGRISKDQRIAIMAWCAAGLGVDVHAKRPKPPTSDVVPFKPKTGE